MILFRTQASEEIGFGHIKRSAYLASLIKKNNDIVFILKKNKIAVNFIKDSGFNYILTANLKTLDWNLVTGIVFDIRTIEQYDEDILKISKERKIKTAQITDLGLNQLDTDITIDGSIDRRENIKNIDNSLIGIQYSILHHKFIHFNKVKKKHRKSVKNILISLGGGVQYRQLRNLIDYLHRYNYNLKLTGGFYLKKSARKILKRIYPKIKFVGSVESLARPLYEADIAIITAGTTSYEAASVGTPALYFYYNKEQEYIADALQNEGVGVKISSIKEIDKKKLRTFLDITLKERTAMGEKGKLLNDGRGVYKIIDVFIKVGLIK